MIKKVFLVLVFCFVGISAFTLVNTWQGDIGHAWSTPTNWALNHVPLISEDVYIPDVGEYPYISATAGYTANCNSISIASGATLRIANGTLNVTNDMTVYGGIWMSSADAVINVDNDIFWKSGSIELINYGIIQVAGDWTFEDGCDIMIATDNTVVFDGSSSQFLYAYDSNSYFGNMTVEQTGVSALWLQNASTYDIHIDGDLTITNNSLLQVQSNTLTVDGTIDVENGSKLFLEHIGGELINNSDFTLNGEMDIAGGDVLIHGEFVLETTGILIIDGGSFVYDEGSSYNQIYGTLNISGGLYSANEQIKIESSATTNITGGIIRSKVGLSAQYSSTFQPSGGIFEVVHDATSYGTTTCSNGNYFHNFKVNCTNGGATLNSDIIIQNDLEITTGTLWMDGNIVSITNDINIYGSLWMNDPSDELNVGNNITWFSGSDDFNLTDGTINVSGNWYFNDGTDAQLGIGNTVNFVGGGTQRIYNYDSNASFGNITVDKPDINPVSLDNSSTYDINVTGDLTLTNNSRLQVQSNTLIVDGSLDIEYGSRMYLVHAGGELINNSNFDLNGTLDIDGGDVLIHGEFDIENTGILTLDAGSFEYDVGSGSHEIDGELNISEGTYRVYESMYVNSTGVVTMSGGLLSLRKSIYVTTDNAFNPSGGTVEINNSLPGMFGITCTGANNHFIDFQVDCSANDSYVVLSDDLLVTNNMEIIDGEFDADFYTLEVENNIDVYGKLDLDFGSSTIIIGNDLTFHSGSNNGDVYNGNIYIEGDWYFNSGNSAHFTGSNTVTFNGSSNQFIYCMDSDAHFNDVVIDQTGSAVTWLHGSSTEDIQISGDLTINPSNRLQVQTTTLTVNGTLDVQDGGEIYLEHAGGELINNSDFDLYGHLDIDGGDVLINGSFYQPTTGVLTIDSGSFVSDTIQDDHLAMGGTLNMSDGLLESRNSGIYILSTLNDNITGGTIRAGYLFDATFINTFQPSGGIVEMNYIDTGTSSICCSEGNYFNDLNIVDGSYFFATNIIIQNNLDVSQYAELDSYVLEVTVNNDMNIFGAFQIGSSQILNVTNDITWYTGSTSFTYGGTINVSGDWYFNDGTDAQLGTGNTVNFVGADNSYIYCDDNDACFGNVAIDKDLSIDMVEVNSNNTIRIAGDLNVTEGMLKLHDQSTIEIGNEFNIYSSFYTQGTSSNDAVITKYGTGFFDLNVETGGLIGGSYTTFENVGSAGVNIKAGAFLDALYSLDNCTFQNGETGGSLLTIDNSQTVAIDGVEFNAGSRIATYNVSKTVDAGEVTFTNSSGLFDGPDYEDDIHNRIHWAGFTVPNVTTTAITDIEQTTATSGGNVTLDGNSFVSARGVCWSENSNPTVADDITSDGTGTGTFVSSLTSLDPDTHYYVRAYATNALGTSYGSEQEFDTLTDAPPDPPENFTIEVNATHVVLNWDVVPDETYKVYSSVDPGAVIGTWTLEQENINDSTWSELIPADKKFYYVSAVN